MKSYTERFNFFVEMSGETVYEIAQKLGFKTPQQLYKITNGQTKDPRVSLSEKIKKVYPKVNLNWLDAGVGEPSIEGEKGTEIEGLKAELELQKIKYENIILKITATKEQKELLGIS